MKKIVLSLILAACVGLLLSAQSSQGQIYVKDLFLRSTVTEYDYSQIDGSPYVTENFSKGKIMFKDNQLLEDASLRYNYFHKKMEIQHEGKLFFLPSEKVDYVELDGKTYKNFCKMNPFHGYVEVLGTSKTHLYKYIVVEFKDAEAPKQGYSDPKPARFEWESPMYYIVINNAEFKKLELNKKKIVKSFPMEHSETLSAFIKKNSINTKKEEELVEFIDFYRSIE